MSYTTQGGKAMLVVGSYSRYNVGAIGMEGKKLSDA